MLDNTEGFRMVQAEYTAPSQHADLNFVKIPYTSDFNLSNFPAPALWNVEKEHILQQPKFWGEMISC